MDANDLKIQIRTWAEKVGTARARLQLVNVGLSFSTAEKLVKGTYDSSPKDRVAEILIAVLAKDRACAEQVAG